MSENTKIIIQEVDQTKPRGSGSSSDIPYIPGLSAKIDAVKNVPVLCNNIQEFEDAFGTEPYIFVHSDTCALSADLSHTYKVGDPDLSYIYAKELLNAGMSVVYENICPEETSNISLFTSTKLVTTDGILQADGPSSFKVTNFSDTVSYELTADLASLANKKVVTIQIESDDLPITELNVEAVDATIFTVTKSSDTRFVVERTATTKDTEKDVVKITFDLAITDRDMLDKHVHVAVVNGDTTVSDILHLGTSHLEYLYQNLAEHLNELENKNEYSVKYITSGGYPTFIPYDGCGLVTTMLNVAATRGDAVALIDHLFVRDRALKGSGSVFADVQSLLTNADNTEYGAMFTTYGSYTCSTVSGTHIMPGSFGYLMSVADAIKTSPNWLAMAGVSRGRVPNLIQLESDKILTNMIAEDYQPKYGSTEASVSINAITNVKPYGLCIWGNRTLKPVSPNGTVATNFLNVRNMLSDIKKVAYSTAKSLMFEQDSDALWLRFKSGVSPLLEQLKSGNGIEDYKIIKTSTKFNGANLTRGELAATIKIKPMYAVEYFEITVVVSDEDVAVA